MKNLGAKLIPLTQGKCALVDSSWYVRLNQFKWQAKKGGNTWYAVRTDRSNGRQHHILMHRVVIGARRNDEVDHINHDGIDNRYCNLRFCTTSQNAANRIYKPSGTSLYRGVHFDENPKRPKWRKWRAQIHLQGKRVYLGSFDSEIEAAKAWDKAAWKTYGVFTSLNFPLEQHALELEAQV